MPRTYLPRALPHLYGNSASAIWYLTLRSVQPVFCLGDIEMSELDTLFIV